MIVVKEFPNKTFQNKEELFKALRENKETLIAQKKMITKEADAIVFTPEVFNAKGDSFKAENVDATTINKLQLKLVINTTNVMDSHSDVHLKSIWKKCLNEKKNFYLLQEHQMKFDHIISEDVNASVKTMNWNELGQNYKGNTEALIFDATIDKRNEYMFNQYAKGYVKNHSVGMRYVKIDLAINSDSKWDIEEKEIWDKYIDQIANKEEAEEKGYFWAVSEAKIIEGSAVPIGSNTITPTLSVESKNIEPSEDTQQKEAEKSLQDEQVEFLKTIKI